MAASVSLSVAAPLFLWLYLFTTLHFMSMLAKSDTYIVHMDLTSMPKAFSGHHSWYAATLSSIRENTEELSSTTTTTTHSSNLIYTYNNVIHGFSASLSPSELESIQKSPGFVSAIRDLPVTSHTTHTSQFLNLNSDSGVWPKSNYGKDVIIGLVDTGIWPESESFNDDGFSEIPSRWKGGCMSGTAFNSSMCNKKLIGAKFFNKGLISNNPNATFPMNSTRDTEGHGTHTSTTAAGNYVEGASYFEYARGTASGMAPKARVAMYKALWADGAFTSDVIAAIDQAIEDGVDVISLSLGIDGLALYQDPIAIASFAAMEKGIFVSTSAGNEGPWYGLLHNGIPWVLTVAAGTVDRDFEGVITLSNGVSVVGSSLYPLKSPQINQVPLTFMDRCNNSKELKKVRSNVVVCSDMDGSLGGQINDLQEAKVSAGVFISNVSNFDFNIQTSFPAVFLTPDEGKKILDYLSNQNTDDPQVRSLEFRRTRVGEHVIAPRVADYSSRGPAQSCPTVLKPDIMGPGTLILASWPKTTSVATVGSRPLYSNFNLISGTSMSCPHLAGIGALLKGIHPDWSPAAIRSAMMTTADVLDNTLSPIKDIGDSLEPASPVAMGAGHVNPNKAIDPGLIYDANAEDYVKLLCSMKFTDKQIQTITRSSSYNCSNTQLDLNYPSFIAFFNVNDTSADAKVTREFTRTVTNVGEGTATYTSKLTGMDGFQVNVEPKTLVFKGKHEKQSYKLTIEGPKLMNKIEAFGSLTWIEVGGNEHVVRSPIVATRLSSEPLSD